MSEREDFIMVCDKCGAEIGKKDKFCIKCGAEIGKCRKRKKDVSDIREHKLKDNELEKLSKTFASNNEKYVASLGNGYIMNYIAHKAMKKGFAILTDKRVYFKGSCLSGKGKTLIKTNEERTIDVKNITGSGFIYRKYWGIIIAMLLSILVTLAGNVLAIVFGLNVLSEAIYGSKYDLLINKILVSSTTIVSWAFLIPLFMICCKGFKDYLLKRKTLFRIEYAGGCIAFDVSFYAKAEIEDFQKQLRRVKDFAEETSTIKTVAVETPIQTSVQNSAVDDLRKYAELLNEGLISQEEYDAMKKKILGL